jgi:signal transduction histidine kinase/DICT domain-containing protein
MRRSTELQSDAASNRALWGRNMSIENSVLTELLGQHPELRPHLYFKSSLTALSRAMEDLVLAGSDRPLVVATFQEERLYRQEAHRYQRIASHSDRVYVLAVMDEKPPATDYTLVPIKPTDHLAQQWNLVVIGAQSAACLICQERQGEWVESNRLESSQRFDGVWTFDRQVALDAAQILLTKVAKQRPKLKKEIQQLLLELNEPLVLTPDSLPTSADAFVQRLVTYLQAGQYKLIKAYRAIAAQENRERLVNLIASALRRSLKPDEILNIAVQEIGMAMQTSRCLIYRYQPGETSTKIAYEYVGQPGCSSLVGKNWNLDRHPLLNKIVSTRTPSMMAAIDSLSPTTADLITKYQINNILMVPVLSQDRLLGIVELHHCESTNHQWLPEEINLVEAVATHVGSALMQAEAYTHLEYLNEQMAVLDRIRGNLVAITGHELRTPLSTIQICLESLSSEPDMSLDMRQVMLNTALTDSERMRKLIQDFLTLSQLESGRFQWHPEDLSLRECVDLAVSGMKNQRRDHPKTAKPQVIIDIDPNLPSINLDGEWLVEVLSKLLDNAYKFTANNGQITIQAASHNIMLEVIVSDNGRGIEPNLLQVVFERFYQEEGALRRTTGGTGLGLAICQQAVLSWGGQIWAESEGKDQGSKFHFTIPLLPVPEKELQGIS